MRNKRSLSHTFDSNDATSWSWFGSQLFARDFVVCGKDFSHSLACSLIWERRGREPNCQRSHKDRFERSSSSNSRNISRWSHVWFQWGIKKKYLHRNHRRRSRFAKTKPIQDKICGWMRLPIAVLLEWNSTGIRWHEIGREAFNTHGFASSNPYAYTRSVGHICAKCSYGKIQRAPARKILPIISRSIA